MVIAEVLGADMDAAVRGRCIAQLVGVAVKLLEMGQIEERLQALENKTTWSKARGYGERAYPAA